MPDELQSNGRMDRRPDPDPTAATAELVRNAIKQVSDIYNVRLDAMDRAQILFHEDLTRVPTAVDRAIAQLGSFINTKIENVEKNLDLHELRLNNRNSDITAAIDHLHDLMVLQSESHKTIIGEKFQTVDERFGIYNERFISVGTQFVQRDVAVSAALQAAEKGVVAQNISSAAANTKSEASTLESIRQLRDLFQTAMTALTIQINDLKSRVDKNEGRSGGFGEGWGFIVGAVGLIGSVITTVILLSKRG